MLLGGAGAALQTWLSRNGVAPRFLWGFGSAPTQTQTETTSRTGSIQASLLHLRVLAESLVLILASHSPK